MNNNLFDKIINKISYRIDHEKVVDYLLKECELSYILASRNYDSTAKHLLSILKETPSEENQNWIAEKAIKQESTDEPVLHRLLFSPVSLNHIRYINSFLRRQNHLLELGGNFVCFFQTSLNHKATIYKKYPVIIREVLYFFNMIWHRICPKLPGIRNMYFFVTKGEHRVFPRPEILGRLYCCGFRVTHEEFIDNNLYIVAKKIKEPFKDSHPSYGPVIRLRRIGKNGKYFNVYKFRTMHAYSEYLQSHIYKHNKLANGGKFANDYRIPKWGRFMRKYWLDELPTFINLLKGNMKFIGVRPLSQQYYNLYSPELQQLRIKTKPGLFPPYYADMPQTLEEIEASEVKYLEQYLKYPFKTDFAYFFKIIDNILFKKKRSA